MTPPRRKHAQLQPVTSSPTIAFEQEEEDAVNGDASDSGSVYEDAVDAPIPHLISDLVEWSKDNDHNMGAEQSHEAINDGIRATSTRLQARTGEPIKPTTGKLKAVSRAKPNASQRKLAATIQKQNLPKNAISPRKPRQKKAAVADAQEAAEAGDDVEQGNARSRRSQRVQEEKQAATVVAAQDDAHAVTQPATKPTEGPPKRGRGRPRKQAKTVPANEPSATEKAGPAQGSASSEVEPIVPDKVHYNELFVGSEPSSDEKDADSSSAEESDDSPPRGTKRKRAFHEEEQDEEAEEVPAEVTEADRERLYWQWLPLQRIFENVKWVGCNTKDGERQPQHRLKQKDRQVKIVLGLCNDAMQRYTHLRDHSGTLENGEDPAPVLRDISEKVDDLRGANREHLPDFTNRKQATEIYFHLIPTLVKLLQHAIDCYLAMDNDNMAPGQITIGRLRIVMNMIEMILELAAAAKRKYIRPLPVYCVVDPVHNGLAVPLRNVLEAFKRDIERHGLAVRRQKRSEEEARQRALQLEQKERQDSQRTRIRQLQDKWVRLHNERWAAEPDFKSVQKMNHLEIPSNLHREYDHNGEVFSRQQVFVPRVGPPPGFIDAAAEVEWTQTELLALCDGLQEYAGERVLERTIRRYCGRGKALNRFSVTELVTTAAAMRESLIAAQQAEGEEVEKWVLDIPVWTKGPAALGKENEDGDRL
ncbi:hypothetical protein BDY17DRAFT_298530 [Neohortaea acidophila]|uniref:Uncharacterized protein n=1 Tax=Neohortaea acidophila TaxID=245834 RepID=A0A6A6PRL3_9PEZI|nr:uncharacterized protein BDY17DRAFT_298530 [Neohortaea acidophila]KAF2482436.1 hypothetical protein BDY17DRAFT_298530 [Neohortaea acidophila]